MSSFEAQALASWVGHIVQFGKFHRIGGAPPFPNVKYDAPEEVGATENVLTAVLENYI